MTERITTTMIGRGHSGTRAFSKLLLDSGIYMGPRLSSSYCYSPYNARFRALGSRFTKLVPIGEGQMYQAARLFSRKVKQVGEYEWNFSDALHSPIPAEFVQLVQNYLKPIDSAPPPRGWKLPETVLMLPWLVQIRPDIKYIHWVRDPRDVILHRHLTDDLNHFGVPFRYGAMKLSWLWNYRDKLLRRAISWKYQHDLIEATPKPQNWLVVRFEDFILNHKSEIKRISDFLDIELKPIEIRKSVVQRWKKSRENLPDLDFLRPLMLKYGYI